MREVTMRVAILSAAAVVGLVLASSAYRIGAQGVTATPSAQTADSGIPLPSGYRSWELISVAAVGPPISDVRAKLGNDIAMSDIRQGTIPYRDGAIIARLAWKQTSDPQTSNALQMQAQAAGLRPETIAKALSQTFVAGPATNVQFMVKDSKKYASTGGWGFAQFTNGKPDAILQQTCYACHAPAKATDLVFTHYSP
ncbi:MAG: cytochrome P460 family protein [Candidatus Eremiobacteraeota bacterium]|nr:cytochrome P460 family protein [Candidatus Eremiobacteraeota bacterium]